MTTINTGLRYSILLNQIILKYRVIQNKHHFSLFVL